MLTGSKESFEFPVISNIEGIINPIHQPADNVNEFLELIANPDVPLIRSLKDFDRVIKMSDGPFKQLPKNQIDDFRTSLKFNKQKGGVASFKFTGIKANLSEVNYIKVLEMFGLSETMADDHTGYACVGVGDCASSQTHICTSNC